MKSKRDLTTILGKVLLVISLALTALAIGTGIAAGLPGPAWIVWPVGLTAAAACDFIWLAGLSRLPVGLAVGGRVLAVTGGISAVGVAGSTTAIALSGHGWIPAVVPAAALFLLAVRPVLDHITPSRATVESIAEQKRTERDHRAVSRAAARLHRSRRARDSDDRALAAQKVTDELLDAQRHDVAREIAVMRGKAQLVAELEAARREHKDAADLLDSLMGSGVEPAPIDVPDRGVLGGGGQAHSSLEKAPQQQHGPAGFGFARTLDGQSDPTGGGQDGAQAAQSVRSVSALPPALVERNARLAVERRARVAEIRRDSLTPEQAAERYGVTVRTVRRWLEAEQS